MSKRLPLVLWLLSAPLIFSLIFGGRVERAQEARVLETAREMVGAGWQNWLIPHCNGQVRLRKPPLAYWAAAASFKIFGVHDWAGRLPFALASWLTLGATYAACRPIIGRRGALLAAAGLTGTYFLVRFGRYAETDVLATLFVTAAVAAIIRGGLARRSSQKVPLYLAAGIAIGGAIMSKGPPAVFPVLFLFALAWALGRGRILAEFLLSGALLALAAVAAPWWWYVSQRPEFSVVGNELKKVTLGLDHPGPPWFYFMLIFLATAPWCALVTLGIAGLIRRWRRDLRARVLLLWIACIIIPMSLVVKKQDHYMLAMLPALMAPAGWALAQALRGRRDALRAVLATLLITAIGGLIAAAGPLIAAHQIRQRIIAIDFVLSLCILIASVLLLLALLRWNRNTTLPLRSILIVFAAGAVLMTVAVAYWRPALEPITYPQVARQIDREFPNRQLVLFDAENLPICFYLARTIPYYHTRQELMNALAQRADLTIIWEQQEKFQVPPPGIEKLRIHMRKRDIVIYEQK